MFKGLVLIGLTCSISLYPISEDLQRLAIKFFIGASTGYLISYFIQSKLEQKALSQKQPQNSLSLLPAQGNLKDLNRVIPDQINLVVDCYKNPGQYVANNQVMYPKGILLYGEPGCGKTALMRALAGEGIPVFSFTPSDIQGRYVGDTERALRQIYSDATRYAQENRLPFSIVFIDEIDALGNRNSDLNWIVTQNNQLLTLLDGAYQLNNVITFAATNRIDKLDPALKRPGRFDWHIEIKSPTLEEKKNLIHQEFEKNGIILTDELKAAIDTLPLNNLSTAMVVRIARIQLEFCKHLNAKHC